MKYLFRSFSIFVFVSIFLLYNNTAISAHPGKSDGDWITLSGNVVSASADNFVLDYGKGLITVEMDDWDWYKEGWQILNGDNVVVRGRIDADLFEKHTIEASSVFVKGLFTYFYASPADEEIDSYDINTYTHVSPLYAGDGHWMNVTGKVTSINGREFTLDMKNGNIQVDTINMSYNPLDNFGFHQVKRGDRISVIGRMDLDLLEKREIMATSIITLKKDKKRSGI